ncbi:hypothetical protein [Halobacillus litoralis]|uniref:hypothetical protein n=1 Tax=Halobacillus litoralis TaxID=45668 RepID=UPI001CD29D67|nr:hypothetical protein [Halobacillus litoralis]MCA1021810.1 hypothetical protein [Halobacillus litoralis]
MREDMECKHRQVETLVEENKRLKESLEFYADDVSYVTYVANQDIEPTVMMDRGYMAKKALEVAR